MAFWDLPLKQPPPTKHKFPRCYLITDKHSVIVLVNITKHLVSETQTYSLLMKVSTSISDLPLDSKLNVIPFSGYSSTGITWIIDTMLASYDWGFLQNIQAWPFYFNGQLLSLRWVQILPKYTWHGAWDQGVLTFQNLIPSLVLNSVSNQPAEFQWSCQALQEE